MRILVLLVLSLSGPLLVPASARAQGSAGIVSSAPDPATLKAARDVVAAMQGDRTVMLNAMSAPMIGLMQQMGVKEPDRAQVLVQEVVVPVLSSHFDGLLDVQAHAFATALGTADLQNIAAFYATPAGRSLAAAQPRLAQAQLTGMSQWMGALAPELQGKLGQAIQAHGWAPSTPAKPR